MKNLLSNYLVQVVYIDQVLSDSLRTRKINKLKKGTIKKI